MTKLNTTICLRFNLIHTGEPEDIYPIWLIKAAQAKLDCLKVNTNEIEESFEICDSSEEPDEQFDVYVPKAVSVKIE
jgi:hypothetical protein